MSNNFVVGRVYSRYNRRYTLIFFCIENRVEGERSYVGVDCYVQKRPAGVEERPMEDGFSEYYDSERDLYKEIDYETALDLFPCREHLINGYSCKEE